MNKVVTRFAPSPTGYLHIGGLRTALFSYLWAKKNGGEFRLRIEDTDQKRLVPGADEKLIATLQEIGLAFEGEVVYQSRRVATGVYRQAAQKLLENGKAYYCFCTPERLDSLRAEKAARHEPPGYDRHCRSISHNEALQRVAAGEQSVVRLKLPDSTAELGLLHGAAIKARDHDSIVFHDDIRGDVPFYLKHLEDAVLLKSDGFPTYHLASVVDDFDMQITHVMRGEEWLPSAPLHVYIYAALGYNPTASFYHLPLILNPDKSKLSKRVGDVSVESYLAKGYLKEALLNYVAMLGWNPGDDTEVFSLKDLERVFSLDRINASPAIFDIRKLQWYNSEYIKNGLAKKPVQEIDATIAPFLPHCDASMRVALFNLFSERIEYLAQLPEISRFLFELPPYEPSLLVFKKSSQEKTARGLAAALDSLTSYDGAWTATELDNRLKQVVATSGLSFGDVFWPVRVAFSGLVASPPPAEIAEFLGKKESLTRLKKAIDRCEG